ncbi:hypothetical protein ACLMJK_003198 [Lecanora helva]
MPDKPLTVLTYAASASLAAVALVYFFNPNYLIDGDSVSSSASTRKKGIVGLYNPANDCFINSVLQALAGLGDLRLYLIRELHRRELGGPEVYNTVPLLDQNGKEVDGRKLASLQTGEVTQGLKVMINKLNERPIHKKTISAVGFIRVLESAFGTRISKAQQDAQELLQIVAERLSEEYHAGRDARKRARKAHKMIESGLNDVTRNVTSSPDGDIQEKETEPGQSDPATDALMISDPTTEGALDPLIEEEDGFPLEGETEARIECLHCHFVPKANPTTFVMLNLMVPQKSSTTLDECLDAHFKKEFIDDYKCDKCRLEHAIETFAKDISHARSNEQEMLIQARIAKVQKAIKEDPEKAPDGVQLPDTHLAPNRRIARHVEISTFPKILVMHLSRSMYDPRSSSTKNFAKLSFPEKLMMGGILDRRKYKLLGMISHKGTHNSGHYETFRRQHLYAPFSTPHVDNANGPYSASTTPAQSKSKLPSPQILQGTSSARNPTSVPPIADLGTPSIQSPSSSSSSASQSPPSTRPSSGDIPETPPPVNSKFSSEAAKVEHIQPTASHNRSATKTSSMIDLARLKRKKRQPDRWWRISDDKVKECKTSDVLGMQKEVYMLFYEIDKEDG